MSALAVPRPQVSLLLVAGLLAALAVLLGSLGGTPPVVPGVPGVVGGVETVIPTPSTDGP